MEPDHGPSDVGRERLAVEQPRPGAPELALEPAQDGGQRRRDPVDQCPVAGQPEEVGGRDEHRPGAPVRIPRGKAAHREAEDGLGDIGVAVRRGDPRGVERLGERELLVGVADAVAPGERPLLDQQAPLGVDDALLRDLEGGPAGQRVLPEPRHRTARGVVDGTVGNDVGAGPGVDPCDVDHRGSADAVDDAASVALPGGVGDQARAAPRRGHEADHRRAPCMGCVHPESHEAHERPDAGDPAGEGLLRVARTARVQVPRSEHGQPPAREPWRAQARETRSIAFATVPDEDRQARTVGAARADLAPVGDMERERLRAVDGERIREREVVRAREGQRPTAVPDRVPEGR